MRLLLLALSALALLPQVSPAYGGEKKCLNGWGRCRKTCEDGEIFRVTCKNHRVCCVPETRGRKRKALVNLTMEETPTTDLTSHLQNVLSTVTNSRYLGLDDEDDRVKIDDIDYGAKVDDYDDREKIDYDGAKKLDDYRAKQDDSIAMIDFSDANNNDGEDNDDEDGAKLDDGRVTEKPEREPESFVTMHYNST